MCTRGCRRPTPWWLPFSWLLCHSLASICIPKFTSLIIYCFFIFDFSKMEPWSMFFCVYVCISGLSEYKKFVRFIYVVLIIFIAVSIYVTLSIYLSLLLDGPLSCFLFLSMNIYIYMHIHIYVYKYIFCEHVHAFLFVIYSGLVLLGQRA